MEFGYTFVYIYVYIRKEGTTRKPASRRRVRDDAHATGSALLITTTRTCAADSELAPSRQANITDDFCMIESTGFGFQNVWDEELLQCPIQHLTIGVPRNQGLA